MIKDGTNIAIFLNDLLASKFFMESACFTKSQKESGDDLRCLLQAMMLQDRNYVSGFRFKDFSGTSLTEYAESIRGCYTDKQSNLLCSTVQYLTEAFPVPDKQLKKINIPVLLYMADVAEDHSVNPMYFRQWWDFFNNEDILLGTYELFCSGDSEKLEKVNGRLAIMTLSFCRYFKFGIPEELKEFVAEVEEI